MVGLLVIIVVSWALLHFIEKKNIDALGIIPNSKRTIQFLIGLVFMMLICLVFIYLESFILKVDWKMNSNINYTPIFNSFVYHIRSALTEDLVFRGAILYILIQRITAKKALLLSALFFGIYHVFSYGMTADKVIPIIYVILVTGFTGYVWAYTFHKTKSIMMALGFHLAYNFIMTLFYKSNPYGELVFQEISKINLVDWNWLSYNLFKGLFPSMVTFIFVKQYLRYTTKKEKLETSLKKHSNMKTLIQKFSITNRYLLAILLFGCALFLSTLINRGVIKQYFPFTAVIFLTLATWILYKKDKKSLHDIGLNLSLRNLSFLPLGILIGALAFLGAKYGRALYTGESFEISQSINYSNILYALYFILPTVAVEEFLFRGYLFKKTIETSNVIIANIIFSILFMSIHVIDENVINNKGMMIFLIISIPVGHLFFATALLKSKTLFFPIGLHLGNNWATRHLITNSNSGDSILYTIDNTTFNTWPSFIGFILIFNGVFLFVTFIIWKWNDIPLINKLKKE